MNTAFRTASAALALLASTLATSAFAGSTIHVISAHSHPTPAPGVPGVGFLTLHNSGGADRLLGATSPRAARIELHDTVEDNGVARMRAVSGGLPIAADGMLRMAPGGTHLMLFGLTSPLAAGEKVPLTLRFERAGEQAVTLDVRPREARAAPADHHSPHAH